MAGRPQAHPNYGFIKQLDIFGKCGCEPSSSHPQYRSWRRRHVQDVNNYLNHLVDTVAIIPGKLLMTRFVEKHHLSIPYLSLSWYTPFFLATPCVPSDFPDDPEQAQFLLLEMGITHLLSISPAENSPSSMSVMDHHVNVNSQFPEALLLALPSICDYIRDSLKSDGLVLVHCRIESRACTAVCAYRKCFPCILKLNDLSAHIIPLMVLVMSRGSSHEQAFRVIQSS